MGRPLNKRLFGADSKNNIKVQFNNGTESVPGYIVKQKSNLQFLCADASGTRAVCKLVNTSSANLAVGEMSITVKYDNDDVQQVIKIAKNLITVHSDQLGGSSTGYRQQGWSFNTSNSDQKWQIEEAGNSTTTIDPNTGAIDLEGDDFDVTYPIPGSGSFQTAAVALAGITFANTGTVTTATGGTSTLTNMSTGLFRSKYNGNFSSGATADISTWDMSFFNTATHLADVVDTYASWGQQTDGAQLGQHNFSVEWKGYINVPVTQAYNFYTESDDENAIWIGDNAVSGLTVSNYDAWSQNKALPGDAASCRNVNTLVLNAFKWYPIRIRFTEFNGGCKFQLYAQGANGITIDASSGLDLAYNSVTNGYNP